MSKHTPGPWVRGTGENENFIMKGKCYIASIGSEDGFTLGIEEQANATLIATAPKLLEALNRLAFAVSLDEKDYPDRELWKHVIRAVRHAKKVLKQAEAHNA